MLLRLSAAKAEALSRVLKTFITELPLPSTAKSNPPELAAAPSPELMLLRLLPTLLLVEVDWFAAVVNSAGDLPVPGGWGLCLFLRFRFNDTNISRLQSI